MREVFSGVAARAPPFRLPDTANPLHYRIEVEPDLTANKFNGRVEILFEIIKPTDIIAFHALRLDITHVSVKSGSGGLQHPEVEYAPEREAAYIKLQKRLPAGSKPLVTIDYVGEVNAPGSMAGLSSTPYPSLEGGVKVGFETMMQPTMARAVYPCLDEPDRKAHFTVSMIVEPGLTCLSNMEVASEDQVTSRSGESKKKVSFKTSPKMSTYLVVLVAGYLHMLESSDFHVPVRVWTALDKNLKNVEYALEVAIKALKTHEKNFGLKYPLPKLDMVGIPWHGGGMEHWGCVTYGRYFGVESFLIEKALASGDENLLSLNDRPSVRDKMRLQVVITHELAHQWFGNIVTTKEWDTVWLNEAFADWATMHALTQMFPEYNYWASFVASDPSGTVRPGYQSALALDSNIGSHAIQDPDVPPDSAFDAIAYLKGCAMIRMMAADLGTNVFLRGIRCYLEEHLYGNATTEELWAALSKTSGKDVAGTMAFWIQTVGYPLLKVQEAGPAGMIYVTQSRFLQNGDKDTGREVHPVSIHLKTPQGVETHQMNKSKLVLLAGQNYKLNADQIGFYRVSYPLSRLHKLRLHFFSNFLSVEDRIGIISDLGAVVATGAPDRQARLSDFLDFIFSISDLSNDLFVWREILGQLSHIEAAFRYESDGILGILQQIRFSLLGRFIREGYLDFQPDDTLEQKSFRTLLFVQLQDHPKVQAIAQVSWNKLINGDVDALNPDIKLATFKTVVFMDNTDETWNKMKSIAFDRTYIRSSESNTALEAFHALGSSPISDLIDRDLEIITPSPTPSLLPPFRKISDKKAPPLVVGDAARMGMLRTLGEHAGGAQATWTWLRENWDALFKKNGERGISANAFINDAMSGLATNDHLVQAEIFFKDKTNESIELLIKQAMDIIRTRARFVKADREDLLAWAKRWSP